jgi:hypothetical protein
VTILNFNSTKEESKMNAKKLPMPKSWDDLYPSRFLKAGHLCGKIVTLTVSDIIREMLPDRSGNEKARTILGFEETEKQLGLNKTNSLSIKAIFEKASKDPSYLIGKKLFLYAIPYNRSESGEAIRIYGSPELDRDTDITIALGPKHPPFKMTMHATKPGGKKTAPSPDNDDYPGAAYDELPDGYDN